MPNGLQLLLTAIFIHLLPFLGSQLSVFKRKQKQLSTYLQNRTEKLLHKYQHQHLPFNFLCCFEKTFFSEIVRCHSIALAIIVSHFPGGSQLHICIYNASRGEARDHNVTTSKNIVLSVSATTVVQGVLAKGQSNHLQIVKRKHQVLTQKNPIFPESWLCQFIKLFCDGYTFRYNYFVQTKLS